MIQVQLPHSLRGQMTLDPAVGSFLVQSLQQCSSSFCLLSTLSSGSAWCRHPNERRGRREGEDISGLLCEDRLLRFAMVQMRTWADVAPGQRP